MDRQGANRKQEMFIQLAKTDKRIVEEYEKSYLFDQNQLLAEKDEIVQALLAVPSSVEHKTIRGCKFLGVPTNTQLD